MFVKTKGMLIGLVVLLFFPSVAPAQAVFLARKALGLISHITDQVHGHQTASVLLEADANNVFTAAEKIILDKPENRMTSKDEASRTLSFTHNGLAVTLKVVHLQDDVAQILVVSSGNNTQEDTNYAVNGILKVCKSVGAHCWLPSE